MSTLRFDSSKCWTAPRTIRDKLDGIVTYWTFRHISNAKMEGFNNKIRWLIKQAYGFIDREYFKLKIYQLPEISSEKSIWVYVINRRRGFMKHFAACRKVWSAAHAAWSGTACHEAKPFQASLTIFWQKNGRDGGSRTRDILLPKQAR